MTLHTRIALRGRVNARELAEFINRECLHVEHEPYDKPSEVFDLEHFHATRTSEEANDGERRNIPDPSGEWEAGNGFGNGFDAAVWINYHPERDLRPTQTYMGGIDETDDPHHPDLHKYCEDGCIDEHKLNPPMVMEVNFDTAYGYRSNEGYGCGTLHALYVSKVGAWLDERGVDWDWYNEFTGEWHHRYEELEGLVGGGLNAEHWFHAIVKPAIEAQAAASGSDIHWGG